MACQGCGDVTYAYGTREPCGCTGTTTCDACPLYCDACDATRRGITHDGHSPAARSVVVSHPPLSEWRTTVHRDGPRRDREAVGDLSMEFTIPVPRDQWDALRARIRALYPDAAGELLITVPSAPPLSAPAPAEPTTTLWERITSNEEYI